MNIKLLRHPWAVQKKHHVTEQVTYCTAIVRSTNNHVNVVEKPRSELSSQVQTPGLSLLSSLGPELSRFWVLQDLRKSPASIAVQPNQSCPFFYSFNFDFVSTLIRCAA